MSHRRRRDASPERLAVRGLAGTLTIALVVLAALNINRLPLVGNNEVLHVEFAEAGGLRGGDDVQVSGASVGKVRDVRIDGDKVVADVVITDEDISLGDLTEARIITITLLGRAALELEPRGTGALGAGDSIPVERTSAPYNLTATLNELTETSAEIDKAQLAEALDQASATLKASNPDLRPALDGITALSRAISANDDELLSLVDRADRVTGVLASRDRQIASLLGSGRSLLAELDKRQAVVVSLLEGARELATELRALLTTTDDVIGPALDQLDGVVDVLNANKVDLQAAIDGLQGYATGFGEALATGPWFDAYIQNLTSPSTLVPILSGVLQ
ncbi:phospholipid/cholesterol/gamma-HCH transport system substrate-binding protein [Nocardioides sp. J9]|uniref:MCE family protein n=1 Tax=Nocardioides sp. J9 TaxID=935844 RepID=UPI0011AAA716|nr:MCE family protein [Nocardioides sp. J9]TWG91553.1 phospholipid/cholesterol/gamma-HCH transport system substrate-binding protein [Nocardioides sp. J9]